MTTCLGSWFDNHNQHHTCAHPVRDRYLCRNCSTHLERRLANLPALHDDLTTTLTRQAKLADQSGQTADTPLVVNLAAANVGADLDRTLGRIVTHLTRLGDAVPRETTAHRVVWLISRFDRIPLDPEAGNITEAVNDVTKRLMDVIDLPEDKRTIPVGLCPETTDAGACPGEVRAHIPAIQDRAAFMLCTSCGKRWETWHWTRAGKLVRPLPTPKGRVRGPVMGGEPRHTRLAVVDPDVNEFADTPDSQRGGRHTAPANPTVLDGTVCACPSTCPVHPEERTA